MIFSLHEFQVQSVKETCCRSAPRPRFWNRFTDGLVLKTAARNISVWSNEGWDKAILLLLGHKRSTKFTGNSEEKSALPLVSHHWTMIAVFEPNSVFRPGLLPQAEIIQKPSEGKTRAIKAQNINNHHWDPLSLWAFIGRSVWNPTEPLQRPKTPRQMLSSHLAFWLFVSVKHRRSEPH